jgi:hypothetical protein
MNKRRSEIDIKDGPRVNQMKYNSFVISEWVYPINRIVLDDSVLIAAKICLLQKFNVGAI